MFKRFRSVSSHTSVRCWQAVPLGAMLAALVITAAGCSRQAPPPPPPPATTTPTTQQPKPTAAAPEKPEMSQGDRTRAIAEDKFKLYERKIKVADFPRAEATLRDLRAVFDLEGDYKSFWDKSIPPSKRIVLTLMSLCETCKDGKCPACKGETKCDVCKGEGKCGTCDGRPVRYQACKACVCRSCAGTGKCRNCGGFKNKKCDHCAGYGTVSGNATTECRRCAGSGYTTGLKGPTGVSKVKCLTCKGTGRLPSRILNTCTACSGNGRLACASCSGGGRCGSCSGTGKTPSCSICSGAGQTVHKCPQCEGQGKCINCEGTGHCTSCHGSGKCFECDGGLVRIYDFPINSDWVKIKEGHVLFDSRLKKVVEKEDKAGFKEINYRDLKLSLVVNKGQIVFIATQPAFDPAITLIRK